MYVYIYTFLHIFLSHTVIYRFKLHNNIISVSSDSDTSITMKRLKDVVDFKIIIVKRDLHDAEYSTRNLVFDIMKPCKKSP